MIPKIYILDDDLTYARLLAANLGPVGRFRIDTFDRSEALLARLSEEPPDAVITDLVMPGPSGVEVTRRVRAADRHVPIFVLTGHADIATAVEALKAGATEYLTKPVNIDELTTLLARALAERPLIEEGASLEQARGEQFSVRAILGEDPKVEEVRAFVRRMAAIPRPTVLLLGESGTGKNLAARAIHYSSPHSRGRFWADLYYRITVAATTLPPLREIKGDLPRFANHFRETFNREFKKRVESIDGAALEALEGWQWPGNVRELRNVIERAMIFSDAPTLQRSDLPTLGRLERVTRGGTAGTGGTEPRDDAIQVPKGLSLVEAERE